MLKKTLANLGVVASLLAMGGIAALTLAPARANAAAPAESSKASFKGNLVVAQPASSCAVTIYGSQMAHVQETRTVHLPKGQVRLQLNGIAAKYRPESLRPISFAGPGNFKFHSATYQEANFTSERVLAESIGKEVTAWRHTEQGLKPVTGKLESANGTSLVLSVAGRPELVNTGDVSLLQTPEGLSSTPSLVVEAETTAAGDYTLEFQYATDGMSWNATHSLIYNEEKGRIESWATYVNVVNGAGVSFHNAQVNLLAGTVAGGGEEGAPGGVYMARAAMAAPVASDSATVESVGDQNVFTLPGTVDLSVGKSRQISLFDQSSYGRNVPVTRTYVVGNAVGRYSYGNGKKKAVIRLSVENCEKDGLGKPLPAGTVEVQQRKSGRTLQLTGKAYIGEKAQNESFDMNISSSSDVKWELKLVSNKEVNGTVEAPAADDEPGEVSAYTPAPAAPPIYAPAPVRVGRAVRPVAPVAAAPVPAPTPAVFSEQQYELVVYNHKADKDVQVKVEIVGTLKQLPKGWKSVTANRSETTLNIGRNGKASVKYTTRTRIR